MELRQLRYFVTVAEELHFGRAAERLHIVQPAVSQQVRRLERELGVELFDRAPRRIRLTPAGERFLPGARATLAAARRAREAVDGEAHTPVRIGTSEGLGDHLDGVLATLSGRAPRLAVELVPARTGTRLDRVRSGQLDATFVRGVDRGDGLRMTVVWQDAILAAVPAGHPAAGSDPVTLGELDGLTVRLAERSVNPPLFDRVATAFRDEGLTPEFGPGAGTLANTLALIGAGDASWTPVYQAHARTLHSPRVAFRALRPRLAIPTYLAVRRAVADDPPPWYPALLNACRDHGS